MNKENLIKKIQQNTCEEFIKNFDIKLEYKILRCIDDFHKGDMIDCPVTNVFINKIYIYQFGTGKMPLTLEEFKRLQNFRSDFKARKYKAFNKLSYEQYLKNHYDVIKKEIHKYFVEIAIQYGILVPKENFDKYSYFNMPYYEYYCNRLRKELASLKIPKIKRKTKKKTY